MFFSSRCSSISSMLHFFKLLLLFFFCTTFSLLPANKRFSISPEKCSNARGRPEKKRRAQQGLEISRGTIINALKVISGSIPWPRKKKAQQTRKEKEIEPTFSGCHGSDKRNFSRLFFSFVSSSSSDEVKIASAAYLSLLSTATNKIDFGDQRWRKHVGDTTGKGQPSIDTE